MEDRYYDLDIPLKTADAVLIARILDAGYQYIGISQTINIDEFCFFTQKDVDLKRKKTKEERQNMRKSILTKLEPPSSTLLDGLLEDSQKFRATVWSPTNIGRARLFRRLNLRCNDPSTAGLFMREYSSAINCFDIVSFCPTTNEALTFAFDLTSNIDVITIDLNNSNDIRITNKQFSMATSRGIYFEFHTAPLFRPVSGGASARCVLSQYMNTTFCSTFQSAGKGVVVSSGAVCGWEIRRPLAISVLLSCLGFQPRKMSHHCLTKAPHAVIAHGLSRSKTVHGAAAILQLLSLPNVISITTSSKKRVKSNKSRDLKDSSPKQIKLI